MRVRIGSSIEQELNELIGAVEAGRPHERRPATFIRLVHRYTARDEVLRRCDVPLADGARQGGLGVRRYVGLEYANGDLPLVTAMQASGIEGRLPITCERICTTVQQKLHNLP